MTYKSKNSLVELVYALNKSQRLFLSRKWSYPPFCDYLYVQLYFAILRDSKRDYAQVKSSLTNIKTSQTANIQNELYVKILDHLKHIQKETPFDVYRSMIKNYSILKGLNLAEQANKWRYKALEYKANNSLLSNAVLVDEESYYFEIFA